VTPLLPRRVLNAIAAVVEIARYPTGRMRQSDLAGALGVKRRTLELALQALRDANLLRGFTGAGGGFTLGREAEEITLGDIARAIDRASEAEPLLGVSPRVAEVAVAAVTHAAAPFLRRLDSITVAELVADARRLEPASEPARHVSG